MLLLCIGVSPAQACTNPTGVAGDIIYNGDLKVFQYCDDANWKAMGLRDGSGSGGCDFSPIAFIPEGQMVYQADRRVMSGCAGSVQIAFGPDGGKFGWTQVSAGSSHTCGIKADGTPPTA